MHYGERHQPLRRNKVELRPDFKLKTNSRLAVVYITQSSNTLSQRSTIGGLIGAHVNQVAG